MRYTDRPLPPYAFLPGKNPHPTLDAEGHSHASGPADPIAALEPGDWRESEHYLHGVDLYNEGFLWEAHEAWEGLWHASKGDAVLANFLQGLIQCAAGCLKIRMGEPRGTQKLCAAGTSRLREVVTRAGPTYMGLEVAEFITDLEAFLAGDPSTADERPRLELDFES